MGAVLGLDKIGTLGHSSGIVTLNAPTGQLFNVITIGGQQYRVGSLSRTISSDVTLSANLLYMVFAVVSGGVVLLRISSNFNSVGPVGFTAWKLVGAFYANGITGNIAFGSFITIEGVPTSDWITWTPTGTWTTGIWRGRKMRIGPNMHYHAGINLTGTPSGNFTINLQESMDVARLPTELMQTYNNLGSMSSLSAGNAYGALEVGFNNATQVSGWAMPSAAGNSHNYTNVQPTVPNAYQNADFVHAQWVAPIVGFTSIPLKDL